MKSNSMITKAACLMLMASATTSAFAQKMNIEHKAWLRMVLITMCLLLWARVRLLPSRFLV